MRYFFKGTVRTEGGKNYIEIPFNVWDETGLKGNIPARIGIDGAEFECKLLPKGKGQYWIAVPKSVASEIKGEADVFVEPIESLYRINHDSPYSKENPIRKIDSIEEISIEPGFCGHCCVSMLAGVTLPEVISVMGKAPGSWSKILEALDYYGIAYGEKTVHPKGKEYVLPKCCIAYIDGGFKLWFDGKYYGAEVSNEDRIVSYLEIITE